MGEETQRFPHEKLARVGYQVLNLSSSSCCRVKGTSHTHCPRKMARGVAKHSRQHGPLPVDFRNDVNSCSRENRIDGATMSMSSDSDHYTNERNLTTILRNGWEWNDSLPRCNDSRLRTPRNNHSLDDHGLHEYPSGCIRRVIGPHENQAFYAGSCPSQRPARASCGRLDHRRSSAITTRQESSRGQENWRAGSHSASRPGSASNCPITSDGEVNRCVNRVLGVPPLEWQSPCSTPCSTREVQCFTSPTYVLPAGARNPGVTPLPRPYGLRPHWSVCRRRVCAGEDLSHIPPPDHLAQVSEVPVGVYFGDDGGRVYPNDLNFCRLPSIYPETGRSYCS